MKVSNIKSSKGNKIANQFYIEHEGAKYFQSYESTCAKSYNGLLTLGKDWDYSRTTLKYLYIWMEEHAWVDWKEIKDKPNKRLTIQKLIDSGEIKYNENL